MKVPDFIPTAKDRRGKGPRTHKQMKRQQRRREEESRNEFERPETRERSRDDD